MRLMFLIAALLLGIAPAAAEEFVQHTDRANGFALSYPKSWQDISLYVPNATFSLGAVGRDAAESCGINIQPGAVPAGLRPSDFVEFAGIALEARLPGSKVVEKGLTTVAGRPGLYVVSRAPPALGEFTTIAVTTWSKSAVYTAHCTTYTDRFDRLRPLFVAILNTFVVSER